MPPGAAASTVVNVIASTAVGDVMFCARSAKVSPLAVVMFTTLGETLLRAKLTVISPTKCRPFARVTAIETL